MPECKRCQARCGPCSLEPREPPLSPSQLITVYHLSLHTEILGPTTSGLNLYHNPNLISAPNRPPWRQHLREWPLETALAVSVSHLQLPCSATYVCRFIRLQASYSDLIDSKRVRPPKFRAKPCVELGDIGPNQR